MLARILDAHALLAFLEKESGYEKVQDAFVSAVEKDTNLLMTTVNYGEVLYIILREFGQEKAELIERVVQTLPIEILDVDIQLAKVAANIKAKKKLSYADCFAAALTKLYKGDLITGDKEFRAIESEIKITWIC